MTRAARTLTVGDELTPRRIGPITQTDVVRFAGAGGDFNPLHHDPSYATRAGLPAVIAMGQMQAGMLASWASDETGVENLRGFSVRFSSPLFLGDTLEMSGVVESVDADGIVTIALTATAGGRTIVTGHARVQTG